MNEISLLQSELDQINYAIDKTQTLIARIQADIARSKAEGDTLLTSSQENNLKAQQAKLADLQSNRAETQVNLDKARVEQTNSPVDSAGQTVTENTQSPPGGELQTDENGKVIKPNATTAPTNAVTPTSLADNVGNDLKKQAQTQSVGQVPGVATGPEDQTGQTNATRARINELYNVNNGQIIPQPNVLSQYASYTYSISLYILTPEDLKDPQTNAARFKNIPANQLLMQSGGAATSARSQYFPLDYYIDDLVITSLAFNKGTSGAHNSTKLTFKIMEPMGFTFLQNLSKATYDIVTKGQAQQNHLSQTYLLVIRFYSYNANGQPVAITAVNPDATGALVPGEPVVKYIPFTFRNITFKMGGNKIITYECEGSTVQYAVAASNARGSIAYNTEVIGSTVGEVCSEFAKKLTQYQADTVREGVVTYHDTYEIRFTDPIIQNAKVTAPNNESGLESTPMGNKKGSAAQQLDSAKISTNRDAKKISATAGQSIVQWLDQLIRSSRYITDQQLWLDGVDKNNNPIRIPNGTPAKATAWYAITMDAVDPKYDPKRNDYVYRIIYTISPYMISFIDSEYFPGGQYQGEHKVYNHWFTGQNTEVLDLQIDFNAGYYQILTAPQKTPAPTVTYDYREYIKKSYSPTTEASNQNSRDMVNSGGASAAGILYSPSDTSNIRMKILGDPAWLQQMGPETSSPSLIFSSDGSINFGNREIVFKLQFNTPADYNMSTGLMIPTRLGNE